MECGHILWENLPAGGATKGPLMFYSESFKDWTSAPGRDAALEYRLSIYHARVNDTGTYTCTTPTGKSHVVQVIVKEVSLPTAIGTYRGGGFPKRQPPSEKRPWHPYIVRGPLAAHPQGPPRLPYPQIPKKSLPELIRKLNTEHKPFRKFVAL